MQTFIQEHLCSVIFTHMWLRDKITIETFIQQCLFTPRLTIYFPIINRAPNLLWINHRPTPPNKQDKTILHPSPEEAQPLSSSRKYQSFLFLPVFNKTLQLFYSSLCCGDLLFQLRHYLPSLDLFLMVI